MPVSLARISIKMVASAAHASDQVEHLAAQLLALLLGLPLASARITRRGLKCLDEIPDLPRRITSLREEIRGKGGNGIG